MGSGYSIAQLLLNDGDGFCIVRFGTGKEEVVKMQDTTHLVSQPLVRGSCRYAACMLSVSDCMVKPYSHSSNMSRTSQSCWTAGVNMQMTVVLQADAPFTGKGLSLRRHVMYAGNHWGVPCTIGLSRLSNNNDDRSVVAICRLSW